MKRPRIQFWGRLPRREFRTDAERKEAVKNVHWLHRRRRIRLTEALGLVGCSESQYYRWRAAGMKGAGA